MFIKGEIFDNKYEILEHIGTGGGGIVYKANQKSLGRIVAIKEIKEEVSGIINGHSESNILKNLKNDYIPSVYDFISKDGHMYTVMEFVEGNTFQKLLDNGKRFSQRKLLKYTRQLCEAAAYLHSRKPPIIHSDIKPANIMLTPEDNICLIDFNISLIVDGNESAIGVSNGYSPPEQYQHLYKEKNDSIYVNVQKTLIDTYLSDTADDFESTMVDDGKEYAEEFSEKSTDKIKKESGSVISRKIDKRSDVYSIGATLYHIAAGVKPGISTGHVTPLKNTDINISEGFAAIIDKAMQKDPDKRYADAKQMLKAVNNLHRYDKRYKAMLFRQEAAVIAVIAAMAVSCLISVNGYFMRNNETEALYDQYVSEMDNADMSEGCYIKATELMPERAEAYEKMAYIKYNTEDYFSAEQYLTSIIDGKELYYGQNKDIYLYDKMYYILGKCYLETENYDLAVSSFASATAINNNESEYYCDYAVALARSGDTSKASEILKIAKQKGSADSNILFVQGEIDYALGNFSESIENLEGCIAAASDNTVLYRAYMIAANAYSEAYRVNIVSGTERIGFLKEAIGMLPIEKTMPFYEMLAQAYIDEAQKAENISYYEGAIKTYEEMHSLGWRTLDSDYALIRLYRIIGNHGYAKTLAENLKEQDSGDYTVYKLLAFIESDIQNEKEQSQRDYSAFENYYSIAKELCTDHEDFEMQLLDEAYEKLHRN